MKTIKQDEGRDYWKEVMNLKNKDDRHMGVANTLGEDDINTIIATAEYFGADENDLSQILFDLKVARYRVFDWLAMGVMSAESNPRIPITALKVFIYSFLKTCGTTSDFIDDLRNTDYDIDIKWEEIKNAD